MLRTNPDALRSNPSLQITGVLRRILDEAPDSPAAVLLAALPDADAMRGEAIALALWGVLQDELLDAPVGDPRFVRSANQLALLLEATLASHQGARPSPSQEKVFRGFRNLLTLASADRQRALIDAVAHLADRPHFPFDALPRGASLAKPASTLTDKLRQPVSVTAVKVWGAEMLVSPPTATVMLFGSSSHDPGLAAGARAAVDTRAASPICNARFPDVSTRPPSPP